MYSMYDALLSSQLCHVSIFFSTFTMHVAPCFYLQSFSTWILRTSDLFGGWTNPFEKYDRQIGSFPEGSGWKFQQSFELPPASYVEAMENWCLKFNQSIDDNSAAQHRHPEFFPVAPPDLHHILLRKCRDNGHHLGITKHHFFMEGGRWTPPNFRDTGGINHESSWRENTQVDIWMKINIINVRLSRFWKCWATHIFCRNNMEQWYSRAPLKDYVHRTSRDYPESNPDLSY